MTHTIRSLLLVLIAAAPGVHLSKAIAAEQKFAIAQFDNGNNAKILVVIGFRAAECQKLIETFSAGLKLDCPACRKDYGSCTTDLGNYRTVWQNQKYVAPYVSYGTHRYIYTGISRRDAEVICEATATKLRSMAREANCVR
jgi:hypothetical protein